MGPAPPAALGDEAEALMQTASPWATKAEVEAARAELKTDSATPSRRC
jgi:hypothetical protein